MNTPWHLMDREERLQQILERWRLGVPAMVVLLALLIMTMPLFTPVAAMPNLALMAVFVWRSFLPSLMPVWLALPLGIVADLWLALPLGINAMLLPLVALLVGLLDRRFGPRPFGFDWAVAALVALFYQLLQWQLLAVTGIDLPLSILVPQVATTALSYPFIAWICAQAQLRWVEAA